MARTSAEYVAMLRALMPKGRAWGIEPDSIWIELLTGFSFELVRIEEKWEKLFSERDTRYTDELISYHETEFGLPDECTDPAATLSERRAELQAKLLARGGLHKQYYIELAAAYGYDIQITEFAPFWSGFSTSGMSCGDQQVIFYWLVTINFTGGTLTYFTSGGSVSGDPLLKVSGIDTLVCLLQKYKPAHTVLLFNLDGYEYSGAFSLAFDAYPSSTVDYLEGAFSKAFNNCFDVNFGGDFNKNAFDWNFNIPA